MKIDGDSPVFVGLADGVSHRSPSGQMVGAADDPTWGNAYTISRGLDRSWGFTTKLGGMWEIEREKLFQLNDLWSGHEDRLGGSDLREEVEVDHILPRAGFKDPTEVDRMKHLQPIWPSENDAVTSGKVAL